MTAPAVNSTVIDAMVSIESILVTERHRHELGDVQSLAASIADVGLLNPITMTRDSRLIAGQRRLEACRLLDWAAIPVRFVDTLDDAAKLLRTERDENTCRKDMLPSEMAALGEALYAIEEQGARERQHNGGDRGRAIRHGLGSGFESGTQDEPRGEARDAVGEALGMHGRTYGDLRFAHTLANNEDAPADERSLAEEALAEMDRTNTIQPPVKRLRQKLRAQRDAQEAKSAAAAPEPVTDPAAEADWIPAGNDRSRKAVERRRELIREMAPRGYTSGQMAELLGIGRRGLKEIARENEIPIVADQVIGRSRHRIDSNRIIREIVQDLENTEMSLGLVDFGELDTSQVENWTTSLSKSIRMLSRLNKQLKEIVQ